MAAPPLYLPPPQVTPAEVKKLVSGISDSSQFQQSGIIIGGTKYMFVRSLERSAYGRKVSRSARTLTPRRASLGALIFLVGALVSAPLGAFFFLFPSFVSPIP